MTKCTSEKTSCSVLRAKHRVSPHKEFKWTYCVRSQDGAAVVVGGVRRRREKIQPEIRGRLHFIIMRIHRNCKRIKYTHTHTHTHLFLSPGRAIQWIILINSLDTEPTFNNKLYITNCTVLNYLVGIIFYKQIIVLTVWLVKAYTS